MQSWQNVRLSKGTDDGFRAVTSSSGKRGERPGKAPGAEGNSSVFLLQAEEYPCVNFII